MRTDQDIPASGDERSRLLMVAAAFPPTGGPGVQRVAKFAKYLPDFGWQPLVWSVDFIDEFPRDATLLDDIPPEVVVHRHGCGGVVNRLRRSVARHRVRRLTGPVARAVGWRVDRWWRHGAFPDGYASWAKSSFRPLCRLIAQERVRAIFSTFSPASNHLLALRLKRRTGLPWIADFRDLWTDDYRYGTPPPARRIADRRLEQQILETADTVIGVTRSQTALLASRVPSRGDRFRTITNGFDPADFEDVSRPRADEKAHHRHRRFVLTYVGRLDRQRAPDALLDGLRLFIQRLAPDLRDGFVFRIVGHVSPRTRAEIDRTGVRCEDAGYVSHAEAITEMCSADALLVTVPDAECAETTIPAKPFEYLAAGRPILHVGPHDGECAALITATGAGIAVSFDARDVGDALWQLYRNRGSSAANRIHDSKQIARYSRIELTRKLAGLLDGLVSGVRPARARTEPTPRAPIPVPTC